MVIKNIPPLFSDIGKPVYTEEYGVVILKGCNEEGKYIVLRPNYQGEAIVDHAYYLS